MWSRFFKEIQNVKLDPQLPDFPSVLQIQLGGKKKKKIKPIFNKHYLPRTQVLGI